MGTTIGAVCDNIYTRVSGKYALLALQNSKYTQIQIILTQIRFHSFDKFCVVTLWPVCVSSWQTNVSTQCDLIDIFGARWFFSDSSQSQNPGARELVFPPNPLYTLLESLDHCTPSLYTDCIIVIQWKKLLRSVWYTLNVSALYRSIFLNNCLVLCKMLSCLSCIVLAIASMRAFNHHQKQPIDFKLILNQVFFVSAK